MITETNCVTRSVRELQLFIGECSVEATHRVILRLPQFVERLPSTSRAAENLILRALLIDFCIEWSERCHDRHHRDCGLPPAHTCAMRPLELTGEVWRRNRHDPLVSIREWAQAMRAAFHHHHPELFALWLRDSIDTDYTKPLATLVATTGANSLPTSRLRKEFLRVAGCSVLDYLTRRRVAAAQDLLRTSNDKMEVIARAVGWKSPKDLYRAIHDATGKTPAEIRSETGAKTDQGRSMSVPSAQY